MKKINLHVFITAYLLFACCNSLLSTTVSPMLVVGSLLADRDFAVSKEGTDSKMTVDDFLSALNIKELTDSATRDRIAKLISTARSQGYTDDQIMTEVKKYLESDETEEIEDSDNPSWLTIAGCLIGACAVAGVGYYLLNGGSEETSAVTSGDPRPAVTPAPAIPKKHGFWCKFKHLGQRAKRKISGLFSSKHHSSHHHKKGAANLGQNESNFIKMACAGYLNKELRKAESMAWRLQ